MSEVLGGRFDAVLGKLTHGENPTDVPDFALDTTGICALDLRFDNGTLFEIGPVVGRDGLAWQSQLIEALVGIKRPDHDIDLLALSRHVQELQQGHNAFVRAAQTHENICIMDLDHPGLVSIADLQGDPDTAGVLFPDHQVLKIGTFERLGQFRVFLLVPTARGRNRNLGRYSGC